MQGRIGNLQIVKRQHEQITIRWLWNWLHILWVVRREKHAGPDMYFRCKQGINK